MCGRGEAIRYDTIRYDGSCFWVFRTARAREWRKQCINISGKLNNNHNNENNDNKMQKNYSKWTSLNNEYFMVSWFQLRDKSLELVCGWREINSNVLLIMCFFWSAKEPLSTCLTHFGLQTIWHYYLLCFFLLLLLLLFGGIDLDKIRSSCTFLLI